MLYKVFQKMADQILASSFLPFFFPWLTRTVGLDTNLLMSSVIIKLRILCLYCTTSECYQSISSWSA